MFKTEQEALAALRSTISELDVLTKSWDKEKMNKAEDEAEGDMEKSADLSKESLFKGDEEPEAAPPPPEGDAGAAPPPDMGAPEGDDMAPPTDGAPEGAEGEGGGDDMMAQVAAEAQQLSDEELDMMLHALMSEKDSRSQGDMEGGDMPPEAPPAPAEKSMDPSLAMSMKEEFGKMAKSFQGEVAKLQKSLDKVTADNAQLRKSMTKPTTRPAAMNKGQVLEKSVKAVEALNKSETTNYLVGEMRKGNRTVTSEEVALVNACRTEEDLQFARTVLKDKGIDVPNKK